MKRETKAFNVAIASGNLAQADEFLGQRLPDREKQQDRKAHKDFLGSMIEAISLDPATRTGEIRYRIGTSGINWRPHGDSNPGSYRERVLS